MIISFLDEMRSLIDSFKVTISTPDYDVSGFGI